MLHSTLRRRLSLADEVRILYWRQIVRVTRALVRVKDGTSHVITPVRGYLWLPPVALLSGILIGLIIAIG